MRGNIDTLYAVKVVDRKRLKTHTKKLLEQEISILHEIRAPNVVSLMHVTQTKSNYYLVMEYCNGGDLESFIKARGGHLSEPEAKVLLLQVVQGLLDIKKLDVMHRDLKLANILIHFPSLTKEEQLKPDFDLKEFIRSIEIVPGRAKQCTTI